MTFQDHLRVTRIQTFGTPLRHLDQEEVGVVTRPSDAADRATAIGGAAIEENRLPVEGDIVGGHYRLVRRLGVGMFGSVYIAERTDVPEHRVALKVINRAVYGGRDVERELVMLAAATHPHIVQLKDHGMNADYVWLTMPLYEGETLAERLERGPLKLREAFEVFLPITRGVHALHERGLRHQDIKPENIFLADIGGSTHPVLLDLGVAVESGSPFVAGTALYGSPEQIVALGGLEGSGELNEKMDTYCLAATLLRAIVGPDEFPGERASSPFDIASAFEQREVSPLSDDVLPGLTGEPRRQLEAALSRWLTRDPDLRPHAGKLADELDVLLEQEREATLAIEREIAQQKASLKRVRIALAAAALIGTSVVLWGVAHRETLRLARELEHARAVGADSFDKLDTCVAAHQLSERKASSCAAVRKLERTEHETTVAGLLTSQQAAVAKLEQAAQRGTGRWRKCVDDKRQAAREWDTAREALDTTVAERDKALAAEHLELARLRRDRDDQATRHTSCEAELTTLTARQKTHTDALAACVADRDLLVKTASMSRAAAAPAPGTPDESESSPPVAPAGASTSAAPAAAAVTPTGVVGAGEPVALP